jgi:hypothetical protein
MGKFRDHKIQTKQAFHKVKRRHGDYDKRFDEVEDRLKEVEYLMSQVNELPPIRIKKSRR